LKIYLAALICFVFAIIGLNLSVIFGYRKFRGSCHEPAGEGQIEDQTGCKVCGTSSESCKRTDPASNEGTVLNELEIK
jgi:hypothetical protein